MTIFKPSTFAERLDLCLEKEGFPPKNKGRIQMLAQLVGLTHRGASKWLTGECTPPARKYPILAQQLTNLIWRFYMKKVKELKKMKKWQ